MSDNLIAHDYRTVAEVMQAMQNGDLPKGAEIEISIYNPAVAAQEQVDALYDLTRAHGVIIRRSEGIPLEAILIYAPG